ncbi:MAG: hypothetical protein Q8M92_06915, partial [Candidatus Subteraquimicrobiales bacterium]|nr:hypothetical protein [Candidatus Subteraquimicrobiales bacterium]
FKRMKDWKKVKSVVIDDMEWVLLDIIGVPTVIVSITQDSTDSLLPDNPLVMDCIKEGELT